jgi:hypothetical protein
MMERGLRFGLLGVGILSAILATGYFMQMPWAAQTWPWPETRLSNIFVSSILAAVAGAMLWVGLSGRLAGAAGGFLHVATMSAGLATVLWSLTLQRPQPGLMGYAIGCTAVALVCLAAFGWVRRLPVPDTRRLPASLRVWSVLYLAILIPAGSALIAKVPGIMPWPVKPEMSMVCGWVFVSAAWSFAYPLLRPKVEHVLVGLVGFLAYDAVLIVPFIDHLGNVRPELHRSLQLYLLALAVTASVSLYYLFVCRATRFRATKGEGQT